MFYGERRASSGSSNLLIGRAQMLRQFGDIRRDAPRIVFRK
jgi:hypothetical protein